MNKIKMFSIQPINAIRMYLRIMQIFIAACCFTIVCSQLNILDGNNVCLKEKANVCKSTIKGPRYLFYDVNYPEGFNLRRDVYMRIAIFLHKLKETNWILVLPPWPHLYHWQTKWIHQDQLPWSEFFDVTSLKQFATVKEMYELFKETTEDSLVLDSVLVLQHYKDAFTKNDWKWKDQWSFESCNSKPDYWKTGDIYNGWFWGYGNISSKSVRCVCFQGGANLLEELLEQTDERYVMLDHAEVILHDNFGDRQYWHCRQSMKFARPLIEEADSFGKKFLNVSDIVTNTFEEKEAKMTEKGGSFLCVHLRRRDFIAARAEEIPSIEYAGKQIYEALVSLNLSTLFIASDAPIDEILELKRCLQNVSVFNYSPDVHALKKFKDGGVAIIEQIICASARYFIGSYESTFSFRIQEEREILGFPAETTFNRLCGNNTKCTQPSRWTIQL